MNLFLAFVILLNAATLIATGYLLWRADTYLEKYISDAIRKQDDRIRKRTGSSSNGEKAEQAEQAGESEETSSNRRHPLQRQAGRPYRR